MWRAWQEAQGLSERTIAERASTIRRAVEHAGEPPTALTTLGIVRFIARPGLSSRTRWTYHQHLHAYSQWLIKAKLRTDDPMVDAPAPRRQAGTPRPVEQYQLQAILVAANRRRTRTMILLAALAGLRVHEIAKVHGHDFDLTARTLTVLGKGGKTAAIPLHQVLVTEAAVQPRDGYWFPSYGMQESPHVDRQAVGKAIAQAMKRAGVDASAHQLRHYFGTSLLEHGADIRVVQELMRHSSLQSTQIYTKVSDVQRAAAVARLELPPVA
jgi:site-specific recombinase XerD